jgi:hypothetical protein
MSVDTKRKDLHLRIRNNTEDRGGAPQVRARADEEVIEAERAREVKIVRVTEEDLIDDVAMINADDFSLRPLEDTPGPADEFMGKRVREVDKNIVWTLSPKVASKLTKVSQGERRRAKLYVFSSLNNELFEAASVGSVFFAKRKDSDVVTTINKGPAKKLGYKFKAAVRRRVVLRELKDFHGRSSSRFNTKSVETMVRTTPKRPV